MPDAGLALQELAVTTLEGDDIDPAVPTSLGRQLGHVASLGPQQLAKNLEAKPVQAVDVIHRQETLLDANATGAVSNQSSERDVAAHAVEHRLHSRATNRGIGQARLSPQQLIQPNVECGVLLSDDDRAVHEHILLLPDAIRPVGGLVLFGRVPRPSEVEDVVGNR